MKQILILISAVFLFTSCDDNLIEFIFDLSKASQKTTYDYKYDSGRMVSSQEIYYTLMYGKPVDSMITKTRFEYNSKGLVSKEIRQNDFDSLPSYWIYEYDSNDSLIKDYTISAEGDTTFWNEFSFYSDGKRQTFQRVLVPSMDLDNLDFNSDVIMKYDTIQEKYEYVYENGLCIHEFTYDIQGVLMSGNSNFYDNDKIIKSENFELIGGIKTSSITYYESTIHPKYLNNYSLTVSGDTIGYTKYQFDDSGNLAVKSVISDYGYMGYSIFYSNDKEIGSISYSIEDGYKSYDKIEYYPNGEVKTTWFYDEEINAH